MKSMDSITKRLDEVEKKSRTGAGIRLEFTSLATALAQTLTGMAIQMPERWEMTWGSGNELPLASDAQRSSGSSNASKISSQKSGGNGKNRLMKGIKSHRRSWIGSCP
jgi:hypothetical protein